MKSEPLEIANRTFMVNRLIQQAPTGTLVREFFKNCEESASLASPGERQIQIYPTLIEGVRKLTFWNTGPGMDDDELRTATDLSSSLNKEMSLDANFGIGAKVSGLAASPHGVRYRSCKAGTVKEDTIGFDPDADTYVRFAAELPDGSFETVFDVTDAVEHETAFDWTEVTLLGRDDAHDTVAFPLGPDKPVDRSYIPSVIFRRFARFAPGVEVRIDTSMTKGGGKDETGKFRNLRTLTDILDKIEQHQSVLDNVSGIRIRYIHDPKHESGHTFSARANPATSSTTFCALVHKNERYDVKTRKAWSAAAPNFGIPFGSRVLTVEIELPDDFAQPSQYRDTLTYPADRELMEAEHFAHLVRELMPEWVRDVVRSESPQRDDKLDDLKDDLQKLLDEYRLPTPILKPSHNADAPPVEATDEGIAEPETTYEDPLTGLLDAIDVGQSKTAKREGESKARKAPAGAKPSELSRALERAPDIIILDKEDEIAAKGLQGRAGVFYRDVQTVFVNGLYPAVARMAAELEREFPQDEDPEATRALIHQAAQRWAAFRVGKAVCYALAKRILDDWTPVDVEKATSPESLSLAADDYRQSIPSSKKWVAERRKLAQVSEAA
jgi:hypothetical protein